MIRSCLLLPQLGLVRVSNCPLRAKEYMKEAKYKRDMMSFNWQLCETVKNVRKYKQKEFLFLLRCWMRGTGAQVACNLGVKAEVVYPRKCTSTTS
jgi:hypothetical protein